MKLDYKAIGQNVRRYRRMKGLTQAQLAEMIGVSDQHISHIECGRTSLSLYAFVNLALALSVDLNDLLGYPTARTISDGENMEGIALDRELALLTGDLPLPLKRQCVELCRTAIAYRTDKPSK